MKAFVKSGFDMLENPNNTRVQEVKDKIFAILQLAMKNFGKDMKYMQSQNATKIIDLLYTQEGLAPHMAEFVALVAET